MACSKPAGFEYLNKYSKLAVEWLYKMVIGYEEQAFRLVGIVRGRPGSVYLYGLLRKRGTMGGDVLLNLSSPRPLHRSLLYTRHSTSDTVHMRSLCTWATLSTALY